MATRPTRAASRPAAPSPCSPRVPPGSPRGLKFPAWDKRLKLAVLNAHPAARAGPRRPPAWPPQSDPEWACAPPPAAPSPPAPGSWGCPPPRCARRTSAKNAARSTTLRLHGGAPQHGLPPLPAPPPSAGFRWRPRWAGAGYNPRRWRPQGALTVRVSRASPPVRPFVQPVQVDVDGGRGPSLQPPGMGIRTLPHR